MNSPKHFRLSTPIALAALAAVALPLAASAQISTWNGSVDDSWGTAGNWTESDGAPSGVPTGEWQVRIENGDTVARTGDISLLDRNQDEDGLFLTNGALNVSGNFTAVTDGGTGSSYANFIGVSGGSTTGSLDIVGSLSIGAISGYNGGSGITTTIYEGSSLSAGSFQGLHGTGTNRWTFEVSGGSLTITNTFDWSNQASDPDPRGEIIIGSTASAVGGAVSVGTMAADWDDRVGQYVLFNDPLGTLTFGKTNYNNISDVQALIDNNYIRKDASVTNGFGIADNGSTWTVSIVPEPSTFALLSAGLAFAWVMIQRRRA